MGRGVNHDGREHVFAADLFCERALGAGHMRQGETHVARALRVLGRERLLCLGRKMRQRGLG